MAADAHGIRVLKPEISEEALLTCFGKCGRRSRKLVNASQSRLSVSVLAAHCVISLYSKPLSYGGVI
jgi:predicted metalloprotease